jgi:hypothetical protein
MVEKLMTYAIGRGMEYTDMPTIRAIAHGAARNDYRFSEIVLGVVRSPQFQMRVKTDSLSAGVADRRNSAGSVGSHSGPAVATH